MNISRSLEILKSAGMKALPVPGTSKYNITFPDGKVILIREAQLRKLADQGSSDAIELRKVVENAV